MTVKLKFFTGRSEILFSQVFHRPEEIRPIAVLCVLSKKEEIKYNVGGGLNIHINMI